MKLFTRLSLVMMNMFNLYFDLTIGQVTILVFLSPLILYLEYQPNLSRLFLSKKRVESPEAIYYQTEPVVPCGTDMFDVGSAIRVDVITCMSVSPFDFRPADALLRCFC